MKEEVWCEDFFLSISLAGCVNGLVMFQLGPVSRSSPGASMCLCLSDVSGYRGSPVVTLYSHHCTNTHSPLGHSDTGTHSQGQGGAVRSDWRRRSRRWRMLVL